MSSQAPVKIGSGSPACPTCAKPVYFAEQVLGPNGQPFHKPCLQCFTCKKRVDTNSLVDRDTKVYCKVCYGKQFAPKGYGFGGGGSFLNSDTSPTVEGNSGVSPISTTQDDQTIEHSPLTSPIMNAGEGYVIPKFVVPAAQDICPRCVKKVYFAEQQLGPGGHMYHKSCFKCIECKKTQEAGNIRDKEMQIYCKACHGRLFGPKGFGLGMTLQQ